MAKFKVLKAEDGIDKYTKIVTMKEEKFLGLYKKPVTRAITTSNPVESQSLIGMTIEVQDRK